MLMLSHPTGDLLRMVRTRPLASVAVGGDRHSVGYSLPDLIIRKAQFGSAAQERRADPAVGAIAASGYHRRSAATICCGSYNPRMTGSSADPRSHRKSWWNRVTPGRAAVAGAVLLIGGLIIGGSLVSHHYRPRWLNDVAVGLAVVGILLIALALESASDRMVSKRRKRNDSPDGTSRDLASPTGVPDRRPWSRCGCPGLWADAQGHGLDARALADPSLVKYVQLVGWRRLPGIWPLDLSLSVGLIPMLLWSALVVNLLAARQSDQPLRRSFRMRTSTAASW
jgi:hypothetical protein